jgi:hypothetical protein
MWAVRRWMPVTCRRKNDNVCFMLDQCMLTIVNKIIARKHNTVKITLTYLEADHNFHHQNAEEAAFHTQNTDRNKQEDP